MTTPSDVTGSDRQAGTWMPLPAPFSKYEVSDSGFGPDQRPVRRIGAADGLATTVNNRGYLMVKPYDDNGKRSPGKTVHSLVLLGFAGPCPPGQESRHLDDDPLNNRWRPGTTREEVQAAGGNLMYGDKLDQARDKADNGRPAVAPKLHRCPDQGQGCEGMVVNAGSRCRPCMVRAGERAGVMLAGGHGLMAVTQAVGYRKPERVWKLAAEFGGYAGTLADALTQKPPWTRRVAVTLRRYFGLGWR